MENVLFDPILTETYASEYLRMIRRYANITRPSVYVSYYNINRNASIYNVDTESTYGRFTAPNAIVYDLYDLTPIFYASQVVNETMETDNAGPMIIGSLSVTTYTIEKPNIDDIIYFSRPPFNTSFEFWRVISVRSIMNSIRSDIFWYDLSLEYAPIKSLDHLNVSNKYVYLTTEERYVPIEMYNNIIEVTSILSSLIDKMSNKFDPYLEMYEYNGEFPIFPNLEILDMLTSRCNYSRYFNNAKVPYGAMKYERYKDKSIIYDDYYRKKISMKDSIYYNTDHITSIRNFNEEINVYSMAKLLKLHTDLIDGLQKA